MKKAGLMLLLAVTVACWLPAVPVGATPVVQAKVAPGDFAKKGQLDVQDS